MTQTEKKLRLLYSTREKYPTYRVDLTELFSAGIVSHEISIDWHMQRMEPGGSELASLNAQERVFVGASVRDRNLPGKAVNHLLGLWHDTRLGFLAARGSYDAVQVRDKFYAGLTGLIGARLAGARFFFWMSYPYPEEDLFKVRDQEIHLSPLRRLFYALRGRFTDFLLYRLVLPRADHVFVQSDRMREDVAARGIPVERMTPVPMGISVDRIRAFRAEVVVEPEANTLLYMGTLIKVRRIDFLIEVLARVRERVPDARLILVGDAPEDDMRFLREMADRLGLTEYVEFTGFVPMEEAWRRVARAAVCLSPFRPSPILDSTSPTKVVEYLALGRPVVANEHPDQSKVLGESGAGFVVPYDVDAFAEAVVRLLSDRELRETMAAKGPAYVEKERSYEALSARLAEKYRRLLTLEDGAEGEGEEGK